MTTVEHKTGKGQVEYLVPELTIEALSLLAKYSAPIRKELDEEIRQLASNRDFSYSTEHLLRLEKARKDANKLFLGRNTQGGKVQESHHVEALSGQASNAAFDRIAKAAGSDWPLRTHQCRRTYARCFVESRMGRTSLIYLKWQFKHSSMSMTQLYASNPQQDLTLFDEIFQQMTEFKIDLIESWLDDQPLAGGAGERLWNCGQFQSRIELLCLPRPPHMPTFVRLDTAGASPQSGAAEVLVYTKPHGVQGAKIR